MVISCPVCATETGFRQVEKVGLFTIYRCPRCELQFAHPLSYSTGFYDEQHGAGPGLVRLSRLSKDRILKTAYSRLSPSQREALHWFTSNLRPGDPVLDIGCGDGLFLAALELQGFDAMGTEVAKEPVQLLKEKGFRVQQGSVDTIPSDWPQPKALMLSEVIEHLSQPVELLETLGRRFPQAVLLLSTPSWQRWNLHLGYRQPHDYPPYHLTRWTAESLGLALKKAGYDEVSFHFPRIDSAEFYDVASEATMHKLGLYSASAPQKAMKDTAGRPLLSRLVARFSAIMIWGNDTSRRATRLVLRPLAFYFDRKGWSAGSVLAVARRSSQTDHGS